MSMKDSDTIGNRSRDLPVCSAVPQSLHHRVPRYLIELCLFNMGVPGTVVVVICFIMCGCVYV
jgi:hypothetical protein